MASKRKAEFSDEPVYGFGGELSEPVHNAPEESHALRTDTVPTWVKRGPAPAGALQRGYGEQSQSGEVVGDGEEPAYVPRRGAVGGRWRLTLGLARSTGGRILLGTSALVVLAAVMIGLALARNVLLQDPRFVVASSSDIEITGNHLLTRPQVLGVFGADLERNIFRVSLAERRADLERLPWVEHATVMRLLPNRLRVVVSERTPVAFVRQGTHIGLVDHNGVLLDMPLSSAAPHYSFPVLTGISAGDPLSTRASLMEIYGSFVGALDGGGQRLTQNLSEVDVTDPEDVKALVARGGTEVLVHFGDGEYLRRYKEFDRHVAEWQQQHPRLASADMRYDGQVVLGMGQGSTAVNAAQAVAAPSLQSALVPAPAAKSAAPTAATLAVRPVASSVAAKPVGAKMDKPAVKPAVAHAAVSHVAASRPAVAHTVVHSPTGAAGRSASNDKMFAALAAARKLSEGRASPNKTAGATP